jgi:biopolymer transport protein ExbB
MTLQDKLTGFAMMGASWVMYLLLAVSVFGLAIAIERAVVLLLTRDNIRRLKDDLVGLLKRGNLEAARARLDRSRSYEARIAAAGLAAANDGVTSVEERLAGATQTARLSMERRLAFLGTVGSNAPFVCLLGTVIGIIQAFHELDAAGGKVTSGLMGQIGEALVATAIGILVAIPAVVFFNTFQRIIKSRLQRADALGRELLAFLKAAPGAVAAETE